MQSWLVAVLFIAFIFIVPIVLWILNVTRNENSTSGRIIHAIFVGYLIVELAAALIFIVIHAAKESMDKVITFVVSILIAHQIFSLVTFISLRREDHNLPPLIKSKFGEYICSTLLFLPMIGDALYTYTLGFVDHLRTKRLCEKLVKQEDEIEYLKREIKRLEKLNSQLRNR